MKRLGIEGVKRGTKCWTTVDDDALDRPADLVNRQFVATRPNQLWVVYLTLRCAQPPKVVTEDAVRARAYLECIRNHIGGNQLDASSLLWEIVS